MSDQPEAKQRELPQNVAIPLKYYDNSEPLISLDDSELDPSMKNTEVSDAEGSCAVRAQHVSGGHTFIVTTVVTETTVNETAIHKTTDKISAVNDALPSCSKSAHLPPECVETTNNTAIVPLSSSLPSKLLRLHAKRSAQALLQQVAQTNSLDSQFGSDEGGAIDDANEAAAEDEAAGGAATINDFAGNDCVDLFDALTPTAPPLLTPPPLDLVDDVGMGSSIEDSEESEVDDELKPLAVDNHALALHDVDLNSSVSEHETSPTTSTLLSEANLERFRKQHHQQLENIYLHPNFHKYELELDMETSPPPAVPPANSPNTEPQRVHRSFLTMTTRSKTSPELLEHEPANSVQSLATTAEPLVNEIDTLEAALVPNDTLAAEIAEAVEFYFSNESLLKDAFLLKHVRRNKEGFVSLKLISSFKRVRQLTRDWKVVGNAVRRKSRHCELNDIGTKLRRRDPLPSFDETMPSRTIVACDLPLDKLSIEKVSDIFSKCGEIALIRILKPGMAIPVDVRQFMNKYPELQQKECALVEYLESAAARDAKHLEGAFQVYDMVAPKKKTGKKALTTVSTPGGMHMSAAPVTRMVEHYRYYNDATYERTRGGSFSGYIPSTGVDADLRYKLRRNNSDFHPKSAAEQYQHHHYQSPREQHYHYQPRGSISASEASSPGGGMNFYAFSPRRYSNTSTMSAHTAALNETSSANAAPTPSTAVENNNSHHNNSTLARRLSNCSDTYSSYSEMSRRPSNCSETAAPPQRRDSNCSESCPCSRRISDYGQSTAPPAGASEIYRKTSQGSIGSGGGGGGERRFSNGSLQFERTFSNASDSGAPTHHQHGCLHRRISNSDYQPLDRKQSLETQTGGVYDNDGQVGGGGGGYNVFRRYSNHFNASPAANKLAQYDNAQYINGRRISTDSGYDRRYSFGSEGFEGSPRSRTGSFLKHGEFDSGSPRSRTGSFLDGSPRSRSGSFALRNAENLVRTPLGPDGSKGFGSRARKFGQTVSPVN